MAGRGYGGMLDDQSHTGSNTGSSGFGGKHWSEVTPAEEQNAGKAQGYPEYPYNGATSWDTRNRGVGQSAGAINGTAREAGEGDEDDGSYMSNTENPDPWAWKLDKTGYMYGGAPGYAANVSGANRQLGMEARNQRAYQMDQRPQEQSRGYQGIAAGSYIDTLRGKNPSLAQLQLQQGLAQQNAAASGMAASARGGGANLAAAQRAAIQQQGANTSAMNQQQAQLRAQEIAAAQSGLGSIGGQMRGQDAGWEQAKAQNEMAQRNLNTQAGLAWEKLAQSPEQAQLEAAQNYERDQFSAESEARRRRWEQEQQNTKYAREDQKGIFGALGSLFG